MKREKTKNAISVLMTLAILTFIAGCIPSSNSRVSNSEVFDLVKSCTEGRLLFFEDFESLNYKERWLVHWGQPVGAGTVEGPSKYVYDGHRSAYIEAKKGAHDSAGGGEYTPEKAIDDVAFFRIFLRLQDGFSMGQSRQLKLLAIKGGVSIENAYGGAGTRPTGKDKFSALIAIDNSRTLHVYYYHADQIGPYGDVRFSSNFFGGPSLSPGKWYCLELMLKVNTPGKRDGEIRTWLDGQEIIKVTGLRFRDMDTLKIRRFTVEGYFGGAVASDTSPQDQRVYIDNFEIATCYIGCK